jgi:hypothetical protein
MTLRFCCVALLFTLLCLAQEPFRKYYDRQNAEAGKWHARKEYAKAIAILDELARRPELQSSDDELLHVLFNLACAHSLAGDPAKAMETLRRAAATGWLTSSSLARDTDFDLIRQQAAFKELVKELQARERPLELLWNSAAWRTPFQENLPEAEKIAGLSRLWSEAKYNFAFFYRLEGLDWDALYISYLPKVQAARSTYEYYRVLSEFCARLRDGHTAVGYPRELRNRMGWPAITTRLVEGRVFINEVRDPALQERGVARGLEIVSVDGAPALSASTPQDLEARTYENSLLGGPLEKPVLLTLRDAAGKVTDISLPRLSQADSNKLPRTPWNRFEHRTLAGNIA